MINFAKRNIQAKIIKALETTPVVLLTGARQTGKTTLMKEVALSKHYSFVTFDDITELSGAQSDPAGFINRIRKPTILDEIQRIPELFLPIKKEVDENRVHGQFALTGSANPLLIPRLGDSLAGRIEVLHLFPLSQGELRNRKEIFINSLFEESFDLSSHQQLDWDAFWQHVAVGGYPEMQERKNDSERLMAWCKSYITMILERDVQDLSRIEGLRLLPNLLKLLACRTANLLNLADLSRSIGLSHSTVQRYVELLRATFLIELIPAWFTNHAKRISKSPKVHILDSGLLTFLLGLNSMSLGAQPYFAGSALESFIIAELIKQQSWCSKITQLYHFRSESHEVDAVLESADGKIVGIEIKSSNSIQADNFKGLRALKEITGKQFFRGIVLYAGAKTIPFGNDLFAVPITALWERSIQL